MTSKFVGIEKNCGTVENQGMVLVNVHPDYIDFDGDRKDRRPGSGKYPLVFYVELLDYVKSKGNYWNGLP